MSFQFPDVTCPNGHKTTPDMKVSQTKQVCTTCGKHYAITAFGEMLDIDVKRVETILGFWPWKDDPIPSTELGVTEEEND